MSFEEIGGVLYRQYRHPKVNNGEPVRQVLVSEPLRRQVLELAHDSIMTGHLRVKKTTKRILSKGEVTRYCRSCDKCQRTVANSTVTRVPLQKMPLIDTPFKRVAVDLIGPVHPASKKGHR